MPTLINGWEPTFADAEPTSASVVRSIALPEVPNEREAFTPRISRIDRGRRRGPDTWVDSGCLGRRHGLQAKRTFESRYIRQRDDLGAQAGYGRRHVHVAADDHRRRTLC